MLINYLTQIIKNKYVKSMFKLKKNTKNYKQGIKKVYNHFCVFCIALDSFGPMIAARAILTASPGR